MNLNLIALILITSSCALGNRFTTQSIDQPTEGSATLISDVESTPVEVNVHGGDLISSSSSVEQESEVSDENEAFLDEKQTKSKAYRQWVNYFATRSKARFQRHINNGQRQRKIIEQIFADYGLPKDLYYVGLIESGYNTYIKSHASAVGPWQFMKGTAKRYGLTVNSSIDERANIYKATEASAKYFQDLYNIFGGWELALCAYNSGEYRVIRAIRKGNTRDLGELIDKRLLPKETRNYVPKVLAAKYVMENGAKYGFNLPTPPEIPELKEYKIYRRTSISKLASSLGVTKKLLRRLNPELKQHELQFSSRKGLTLLVPRSSRAKALAQSIFKQPARIITKPVRSSYYRVKKGDSLLGIADKHSSSVNEILRWNRLSLSSTIYPGQKLKVESHQAENYRVRKGDNLSKIARKFSLSLKSLMKKNRLSLRSKIYPGQKLSVGSSVASSSTHRFYKVRRGDTLTSIARKFEVSINQLKRVNKLSSSKLYVNKRLVIPST